MRTCPRCGYVDPVVRESSRRYEKTSRGSRAAYMREYRARKRAEEAKAKKRKGAP